MNKNNEKKFTSLSDLGKMSGQSNGSNHKYLNDDVKNKQIASRPNVGWLFYKDYFKPSVKKKDGSLRKGIDFSFVFQKNNDDLKKSNASIIRDKNERIIKNTQLVKIDDGLNIEEQNIELRVNYPGLITGVGITHEAGVEGEFKLGVHFDYTFGCPVIYGSSVKGLLRSAFPGKKDKYKNAKKEFITKLISSILERELVEGEIDHIENEIFEGKNSKKQRKSIYDRDVFLDALVIKKDKNNRFLESDSITPHRHPLKNPVPLPFLKISAGTVICFRFNLKKGEILTTGQKKDLFDKILLTIGVGAKTNVGYGQFIPITDK